MLPNVYGWSWTPGHVIFVSVFFAVGLTVALAVLIAWWRSIRDLRAGRTDEIRWKEEFHDLPAQERRCRHEIGGKVLWRECDRAFDCRECPTHPKLMRSREPADVYYDRGHMWVRAEMDGTLCVGLDDMALRLIGTDAHIELPSPGTTVRVHAPAAHARMNGHEVRILSPVDGEVVETIGRAAFRVKPSETPVRLTHLLSGQEAEMWRMREMERLQLLLGGSLADGGSLVEDVPRAVGKADWSRVWGTMMLEP